MCHWRVHPVRELFFITHTIELKNEEAFMPILKAFRPVGWNQRKLHIDLAWWQTTPLRMYSWQKFYCQNNAWCILLYWRFALFLTAKMLLDHFLLFHVLCLIITAKAEECVMRYLGTPLVVLSKCSPSTDTGNSSLSTRLHRFFYLSKGQMSFQINMPAW